MKSKADTAVMVDSDVDLGSLGAALARRWGWILWPTLFVAIIAAVVVNMIPPRYKSEARLVYDGRENVFLRPEAEKPLIEDRTPADAETLTDQVQIVLSRAVALDVIASLKLNELPEFDPLLNGGVSDLRQMLTTVGLAHDLLAMTPQERVLESWYDRLAVYPVDKSRVIVIEFQSTDPALAARITNAIAADYLRQQQALRQQQTRDAGQWLSGEIENLRHKVADAEANVENFRSRTNLFVGTNNTTLSGQQLGEFNSQVAIARGQKADAETRSRVILDMLRKGEPINSSDIVNSELIRRLSEQRVTLRAQLAEQSSTLLDGHPRIKELKAQIADLDRQIRAEAERLAHVLENEAHIASARLDALNGSLDALKKQAAATNGEDVELRALEREAKAQRDLLESYLARYRETMARESIGSAPADAKIISAAIETNTPYFPKKVPIVAVATLITFLMCCGLVTTSELLRASAPRRRLAMDLVPVDAPPALSSLAAPAQQDNVERMARAVDRTHAHLVHGKPSLAAGAGSVPAEQDRDDAGGPEGSALDGPSLAQFGDTSPDEVLGAQAETDGADAWPAVETSVEEPMAGSFPVLGVPLNAIKDVAIWLGQPGGGSQRVAFLSATADLPTSLSAVKLARTLASGSRVVVVGLIRRAPVLEAISAWPDMPGLSDVIFGAASFGQIISKDKLSRAHVVHYGRSDLPIEALLSARQFAVMMEALRRAYDHVILDAGTITGDCFRLAAVASRCVLIARGRTEPATTAAFQMLSGAGFTEIAIMTGSTTQPHGRAAA